MAERQVLEPDVRAGRTADFLRGVAVAAIVLVLCAATATAAAMGASSGAAASSGPESWRPDYDRGWAWLVQTQLESRRPDERARAECRWWVDGDGAKAGGVEDRAAFVAGCDTAAVMTRLEGP